MIITYTQALLSTACAIMSSAAAGNNPDSILQLNVTSQGQSDVLAEPGMIVPFEISARLTSTTDNGGLAGLVFDLHYEGGDMPPLIPPVGGAMAPFIPPNGFSEGPLGFGGTPFEHGLRHIGGGQNTMGHSSEYPSGDVIPGIAHTEVVVAQGFLVAPAENGMYEVSIQDPLATVLDAGQGSGQPSWTCRLMKSVFAESLRVYINQFEANVAIDGDSLEEPATRCLTFVPRNAETCGEAIDVAVQYQPKEASASAEFSAEIGDWTEFCVKDRQHSLFEIVTTGSNPKPGMLDVPPLRGGDINDSGGVDILDVSWFIAHYGAVQQAPGCPWNGSQDADFNLDGVIGAADYVVLSQNWLEFSACTCPSPPVQVASGTSIPSDDGSSHAVRLHIDALPAHIARSADLNRDGFIDYRDVRLFETRHDLPRLLSARMEATD